MRRMARKERGEYPHGYLTSEERRQGVHPDAALRVTPILPPAGVGTP